MKKFLIGIFIIFALIYVFFISYLPESFKMLFKLIPMLIIIFIAYTLKPTYSAKYKRIIMIALLFCAIGDYTLQWFEIGLTSFLIGHLFYIYAFSTITKLNNLSKLQYLVIIYGIAMMALIGGTLFYNDEKILAVMVILYIAVIVTMGLSAISTKIEFAKFGAILFILSDSILAVNKFLTSVPFSHQLVMLTYYGAQILLALSIANQPKSERNDTIEHNEI